MLLMEAKNSVDATNKGNSSLQANDQEILPESELRKLSKTYASLIPRDGRIIEESDLS